MVLALLRPATLIRMEPERLQLQHGETVPDVRLVIPAQMLLPQPDPQPEAMRFMEVSPTASLVTTLVQPPPLRQRPVILMVTSTL
jgi:hypothetical protein